MIGEEEKGEEEEQNKEGRKGALPVTLSVSSLQ